MKETDMKEASASHEIADCWLRLMQIFRTEIDNFLLADWLFNYF